MKGRNTNLGGWFKKSSPTLLAIAGSVGVALTVWQAIKATPKANQLIMAKKVEKGRKLTALETIGATKTTYVSTAVLGIATIGCIFGSNCLSQRNQAALASAYALLDQSYKKYKTAAKEVFGDDAEKKINAQIASDTRVQAGGYMVYNSSLDEGAEKTLFYDTFSDRYFNATVASVINAEYHVNRMLALTGSVPLNDYYAYLGIDPIENGWGNGWDIFQWEDDGVLWLDFDNDQVTMDDGMECCVISAMYSPESLDV